MHFWLYHDFVNNIPDSPNKN